MRAAQLTAATWFDGVEAFPPERWATLAAYEPNVLIGPASALQRLVERIDLRTIQLSSVDHAIFVLTEVGDKPLTDVVRVVLWQRFGVPVYELFLDPQGALLASECEAQEGWHVEPGARFFVQKDELWVSSSADTAIRTGLSRFLETDPCACGRPGLRIVDPDLEGAEERRSLLAATA